MMMTFGGFRFLHPLHADICINVSMTLFDILNLPIKPNIDLRIYFCSKFLNIAFVLLLWISWCEVQDRPISGGHALLQRKKPGGSGLYSTENDAWESPHPEVTSVRWRLSSIGVEYGVTSV